MAKEWRCNSQSNWPGGVNFGRSLKLPVPPHKQAHRVVAASSLIPLGPKCRKSTCFCCIIDVCIPVSNSFLLYLFQSHILLDVLNICPVPKTYLAQLLLAAVEQPKKLEVQITSELLLIM